MSLIMRISFNVYAPSNLKDFEEEGDGFCPNWIRREKITQPYDGLGTSFRRNSLLANYFIHQHNISRYSWGYFTSSNRIHSFAKKVFDFTLGVAIVSLVEALFYLIRAVHNFVQLFFCLVKGDSKGVCIFALKTCSDLTKSIENVVKAIPFLGMIVVERLLDPLRIVACAWFEKDPLDLTPDELEMHGLEDRQILSLAPQLTPDEECFATSEVRRLVVALDSHFALSEDSDSIDATHPLKALTGIIKYILREIMGGAEIIDLMPWEATLGTMGNTAKARMTILAYLVEKYPQQVAGITSILGVDRVLLINEGIQFEAEGVFIWLLSGIREQESMQAIDGANFNVMGALFVRQRKVMDDPRALRSLDLMFRQLMRITRPLA